MIKTGSRKLQTFIICTLTIFSFFTFSAQGGDVEVFATVDRNEMGTGDTFTYKITVSAGRSVNAGAPILPELTNFDLINTWTSSESRSSFVNGKFEVQQSRIYNYMLAPKKQGRLSIGGATVQVDGQTFTTKPITISVMAGTPHVPKNQQQAQEESEDPFQAMEDAFNQLLQRNRGMGGGGGLQTQPENPNEAFFIQVDVDKTKVYEGEQLTASWYLYTKGQIRDIDTLKYPSLNGFWKEEIELATRLNFQQEIVNGVVYHKALLASFALFPIKAGTAKIDSYKAKCTVMTSSAFGFGRPYQATKVSKPVKIEVMPLPKDNRPKDFTGAVGVYDMKASLEPQQSAVNQPVTLKIRFEGRGNAKLIDLPSLQLPPSLEEYDTKVDSKYFRDGKSYKEFEILLIPREPGDFEIPGVSVSLFDPIKSQFYQKQSPSFHLKILPGNGQKVIPSSSMAKSSEPQNDKPQVPGLILEWSSAPNSSTLARAVGWSAGYVFVFLLLGWRSWVEFGFRKSRKDLEKIIHMRIQKVKRSLKDGDWRAVGVQSTNSLYSILGEISGEGGASQELEKLLQKSPPSLRRELAPTLKKLLEYFETLSFAPEDVVGSL
ncbi:MAG: protein BatD, partial [Bdellovibrionales bacterium]|nr:protein BatD [Bdellovibrionales bacterium]